MKESSDNNWVSFSDIMTVLMIIFLFISISYMMQVKKEQAQRDEIFEEFKATKEELYNELNTVFKDDFQKWDVKLDKDLSIKFTNPDVLFQSGRTNIRPYFSEILNKFLPKYFDVILQEKYKDKISEIRVEGHTDNVPAPRYDQDPYIANTLLSQERSSEVIKHFREMDYFKSLSSKEIILIEYLLTANGLSYGRTVDDNGKLTINSNQPINNQKSRRVEFRIITTSDKLIDKVLKELEK
ncbi:OmpA/MotB family protein [Winogradskyella poriferorum]|uniref:OmpA-like domain-containing protein n=1 Tax=Winogradskyella poriferorum TaxID=307627 RepID=A0ABU7W095_9FLAO